MKLDLKYQNAFTESYEILNTLNKNDFDKIPNEIIHAIEKNRNKEYRYEINKEKDLRKQKMLPETKALLFNIFRDYLATPIQKRKIIKMQREEKERLENKKRELYNPSVFKKNK